MGDEFLDIAQDTARAAGTHIALEKAKTLSDEGKDIKLNVDKSAHALVVSLLEKTGIPILSEEDALHDFTKGLPLQWVVDPLDGSLNFLRGIPASAVSIALCKDGQPVLGVIYDFNRNELFAGIMGQGATLNGKPITVSQVSAKSEAVLMTGFPSFTDYSTEALGAYVSQVQTFKKVRLFGSAALSLAYVACGRADAYFEKDIRVWDVAAGIALVNAAGGVCGFQNNLQGKSTVAAANSHNLLLPHE